MCHFGSLAVRFRTPIGSFCQAVSQSEASSNCSGSTGPTGVAKWRARAALLETGRPGKDEFQPWGHMELSIPVHSLSKGVATARNRSRVSLRDWPGAQ